MTALLPASMLSVPVARSVANEWTLFQGWVIAPSPVLVVNQVNLPSSARAELLAIRQSLAAALATDMD